MLDSGWLLPAPHCRVGAMPVPWSQELALDQTAAARMIFFSFIFFKGILLGVRKNMFSSTRILGLPLLSSAFLPIP